LGLQIGDPKSEKSNADAVPTAAIATRATVSANNIFLFIFKPPNIY
jgi:hypothetical protein